MKALSKKERRKRRHKRIRSKVKGTFKRPRLSLFRSNRHIYAFLVDDEKGRTLVSASDFEIKRKAAKKELAFLVGKLIAKKALKKKINRVIFDRAGYHYHGRVKALTEGAREGGLKF